MTAAVTLETVKSNAEIRTYILQAHEHLGAIGFTEHGPRHAMLVANIARNILSRIGFDEREAELASIAGYLHDIGNVVGRHGHGEAGAVIAWTLLRQMGMNPEESAIIAGAVGNHEEEYGQPVSNVSAALILGDKSDVHRSRVRKSDAPSFDIHDRVNMAVTHSFLRVNADERTITLELTIDTAMSPVMDYFEIFLTRMVMCRRAAEFLGNGFGLLINDVKLL